MEGNRLWKFKRRLKNGELINYPSRGMGEKRAIHVHSTVIPL